MLIALQSELIGKIPNLKELRLNRFPGFPPQNLDLSSLVKLEVLELFDCGLMAGPELPPSLRELTLFKITAQPTTSHSFQFSNDLPLLEKLYLYGLTFGLPEICRLLDGINDTNDRPSKYSKLKMLGITGAFTGLWPDGLAERDALFEHPRLRDVEELVFNLSTDLGAGDDCVILISSKLSSRLGLRRR
jgi:hypothetical protein